MQKVAPAPTRSAWPTCRTRSSLRGKGADTVGVFNVYANSPQGLYWLKSSGIKSVKDLAGKKIGNPAGDGARDDLAGAGQGQRHRPQLGDLGQHRRQLEAQPR